MVASPAARALAISTVPLTFSLYEEMIGRSFPSVPVSRPSQANMAGSS